MENCAFFSKEEYYALPIFLQIQMHEIDLKFDKIFLQKKNKKEFSLKFLKEIKNLLQVILVYPEYVDKTMVSSIGLWIAFIEVKLTPECEKAIEELMDAEIKEDINSFIREIIQKIDLVIYNY